MEHNHGDGSMSLVFDDIGAFCGYRKMNIISFSTQLLDLNEDCLLQIFGYLNIMDLAHLCESSASLKASAETVFQSKHSSWLNFMLYNIDINYNANGFLLPLKHFGSMAKSISLSTDTLIGFSNHTNILKLLAKYCGKNIRVLTMVKFHIDFDVCNKSTQVNILDLMINLHALHLMDGALINCASIFEFCQNSLMAISLLDTKTDLATKFGLIRNYPKLQQLTLYNQKTGKMPIHMHQPALIKLLTLNADVSTLEIRDNRMSNEFLAKICNVVRSNELIILFTRKLTDMPYVKLENVKHLILLFERNKMSFWGYFAFFHKWSSSRNMMADLKKYTSTRICVHDCHSKEYYACRKSSNLCSFNQY